MWNRNPELLRANKTNELYQRYGHRVIAIPTVSCPSWGQQTSECQSPADNKVGQCRKCGFLANTGRLYLPLEGVEHSHTLVKNSPNPAYPERLEHRWLTEPPVLRDANREYVYLEDFELQERKIVWLRSETANAPADGAEYTVSYTAYAEDNVQLIHASGERGLGQLADAARFTAPAVIEQGAIMLSIPPEARGYHVQLGDIFVVADGSERYSQTLDVSLENRTAWNQWVIGVERAFYRRKVDDKLELVDITAQTSFDFMTKQWSFGELPSTVTGVSVTFDYAPMYMVYTDKGESRTPHFAAQPRLVKAIKMETTF
jgi:hypothetical protein